MKRASLLAGAALLAPFAGLATETLAPASSSRLPGFASTLGQRAITGPAAWQAIPDTQAWAALSRAAPGDRQRARWDYARSLIAGGRGAEAQGVLKVMEHDDADLAMVPGFRLARGAAFVLAASPSEAMAQLGDPALAANSEGCAWRMRARSDAGHAALAIHELSCAVPAINARDGNTRLPFVLSAARAAIENGTPADALRWLGGASDTDPEANLLHIRALMARGRNREAKARLDRMPAGGSATLRMDVRLTAIELAVAGRALQPQAALQQLADFRFQWRGDRIEERALRLSYRLSNEASDPRAALASGAVLFRFFDPAAQGPGFVAGLQGNLAAVLDEANKLPLAQAAGTFWDYRDLMPSGSEGDRLVGRLGQRLQSAGLYDRAAVLFEHLLFVRAQDLAQGPLSVRVASLHILAGHPDRALSALRRTVQPGYTDEMIHERKRVEAAALSQMGKVPEAFAVLQEVPGADALRSEIVWKKRDWAKLVAETTHMLPASGALNEVDQAILLRHAIALAMLAQEDALTRLHARYSAAFARLPTAAAFELLTASPNSVDPEAIARAMASLPAASPAGDLAALFDAEKK